MPARFLIGFFALVFFVSPLGAHALGASVPFGGIVVSPAPTPCINIPHAYVVDMVGYLNGKFTPFSAITVPKFTRSYLFGPLKNAGQWGLGSGIPGVKCITGPTTSIIGIKIDNAPGHGSSKF